MVRRAAVAQPVQLPDRASHVLKLFETLRVLVGERPAASGIGKNRLRRCYHTQRAYRQDVMALVKFLGIVWPNEATSLLRLSVADVPARSPLEPAEWRQRVDLSQPRVDQFGIAPNKRTCAPGPLSGPINLG